MRKSGVILTVLQVLVCSTALLWLLWYFVPVAMWVSVMCTLVIAVVACWRVWLRCRRLSASDGATPATDLLLSETQGPIILVCGDGQDALFPDQPIRKTSQGCWLNVGEVSSLVDVVRDVWLQHPRQVGQLCVMYRCLPDSHQDEGMLRATVKTLRQQIKQLHSLTGCELPVVVSGEFTGPEIPWAIIRGNRAMVCPADESVVALADWQQKANNLTTVPVLSQAYGFISEIIIDELTKADRLCPALHPFAVAIRTGAPASDGLSLWSQRLSDRTRLQFSHAIAHSDRKSHFADALLPMLSPVAIPLPGKQGARCTVWLVLLCALAAIGFSVTNNRDLIHRIGASLERWNAIPMHHYEPKAQSMAALKQNLLLLERWQRQGEPLRYALGLYTGQRLWLAVQQAIDTYVPPPPPPPPPASVPKTVRLDSLSLFDTGKAVLKPGSLKMLVSALVDIHARPGWLIVVAGHTDSTGSAQANQQLSLERAEALRDWMLSTSDVSAGCFAVQGFGNTRPMATNDTPEGRALNRRVEISLVPQANACQAPASGADFGNTSGKRTP